MALALLTPADVAARIPCSADYAYTLIKREMRYRKGRDAAPRERGRLSSVVRCGGMRLYKRGPTWWCSFPWEGVTVRQSTKCATRAAALLVAQRWERERADPDHAAATAATFGGAVAGFLRDLERGDKPDTTKRFYRQKCGVLNRHLGPDTPLSEVNATRVDAFIAAREKEAVAFDDEGAPTRTVTANTIHKELVALRQVLKRARRRGELRRDVDEIMPVGFSPKYEPRKLSLTREQAGALIKALPARRGAAVAFVLATSARRSEVFAARVEDIDRKTGRVRLRGTKTAGAERTVTVAPFARGLLTYALTHGGGTDGLVVRPWPNARRGLERACARIGAPRVTWNDLRRSLSTWLIEGGVSDYVVSKVLGHATTTMVHRVYGKPRDEAIGELLTRQSQGLAPVRIADARAGRVRVVYVSRADSNGTHRKARPVNA